MFALNDQNLPAQDRPGIISEKYVTVLGATQLTGYNSQYLRRLLRNGKLTGMRVGQSWLILLESLDAYLVSMKAASDRRCGPKVFTTRKKRKGGSKKQKRLRL
jgi:excisionase family DNA binding protein